MMDLRFYTQDGRLIFICADYIRIRWQDCLKDEGLCEITLLKNHPLFDLIIKEPLLIVNFGESQGIVCGYRAENDTLVITVKTLLTLLKRRLVMGQPELESFIYSGNPLDIIRDSILKFAPHITFSGEVRKISARTVSVEYGTDLLKACKQLLDGTGVGMKISFSPADSSFNFSFVYPKEHLLRFSNGNRNLSSVTCLSDFSAVKNSGYYIQDFGKPIEWDPDKNSSLVQNYNPENFMKQFKLLSGTWVSGDYAYEGDFLYCDTKDGKLKISQSEMVTKIKNLCLEENPLLVFEQDLRKYTEDEVMSLLQIRRYISELWNAEPICDNSLAVGTVLSIEKEVGLEKGIKKLQVISVKTDTEKPLPEIELA